MDFTVTLVAVSSVWLVACATKRHAEALDILERKDDCGLLPLPEHGMRVYYRDSESGGCMFGLVPVWAWWLSGGWAAKTVLDKMKPPPGGRPGVPGVQAGAPGAQIPQQVPPPRPVIVQGPPPARPGRPCQFDPHMDERTEGAVVKCLQSGNIESLRGFADSVTTKLPPQAYPYGYFPVAATIMRMQAQLLEQQAQAAAAAAAAHPSAPAPTPAQPPPPSKQTNGAASAPVAAIVAAGEVTASTEG